MNGSRRHRLPCAGLTQHENRRPGVGDALDQVEHLEHAVVVTDDVAHAETLVELLLERLVLGDDLLLAECPTDREVQFVVDDRLGEIVEGPEANGFDGAVDRAEPGQQNDLRVGDRLRGPFEQLEAVSVGKVHVTDDGIERILLHPGDRFVAGGGRLCAMAETPQIVGNSFEQRTIVIDDQ